MALEHGQDSHVTDNVHHHRWPLPLGENPSDWLKQCACGMKSFETGSDWQLLGCRQRVDSKGTDSTDELSALKENRDLVKQCDADKNQIII